MGKGKRARAASNAARHPNTTAKQMIRERNQSKRTARTVLTGMCYSVGSATRQGSSSLTRFIGQSAMTSRT